MFVSEKNMMDLDSPARSKVVPIVCSAYGGGRLGQSSGAQELMTVGT
jgi:hypothetical protein